MTDAEFRRRAHAWIAALDLRDGRFVPVGVEMTALLAAGAVDLPLSHVCARPQCHGTAESPCFGSPEFGRRRA